MIREIKRKHIKVINRIVNGRSAVTAEMALKLGAALGTTLISKLPKPILAM